MSQNCTLFLDFDGVLHSEDDAQLDAGGKLIPNPRLFIWRPVLVEILAPYPDVEIIVSSDWRRVLDDDELRRMLGPLGERFKGVVESFGRSRAGQILVEVRQRKLTDWLAIDDHPTVARESRRDPRFIPCNPVTGLSDPDVQMKLREALANIARLR